jgi:hypothetical protein
MATRVKHRPRTGTDAEYLASFLTELTVWKILAAYADKRIDSGPCYDALRAAGMDIAFGQLEPLRDLAWGSTEATITRVMKRGTDRR